MHKPGGFMTGHDLNERAHKAAENVWFILVGRAAIIAVSLMLIPIVSGLVSWISKIETKQIDHGERLAVTEATIKEDHDLLLQGTRERLVFQAGIAERVTASENQIDGVKGSLNRIELKLDKLIDDRIPRNGRQ